MQKIQRPLPGLLSRKLVGEPVNLRVVDRRVNKEALPEVAVDLIENPFRIRTVLPMRPLADRVPQLHPVERG